VSQILAKLVITHDDQGHVTIEGTGPQAQNTTFLYGLLEVVKDIIRAQAGLGDLPH